MSWARAHFLPLATKSLILDLASPRTRGYMANSEKLDLVVSERPQKHAALQRGTRNGGGNGGLRLGGGGGFLFGENVRAIQMG